MFRLYDQERVDIVHMATNILTCATHDLSFVELICCQSLIRQGFNFFWKQTQSTQSTLTQLVLRQSFQILVLLVSSTLVFKSSLFIHEILAEQLVSEENTIILKIGCTLNTCMHTCTNTCTHTCTHARKHARTHPNHVINLCFISWCFETKQK